MSPPLASRSNSVRAIGRGEVGRGGSLFQTGLPRFDPQAHLCSHYAHFFEQAPPLSRLCEPASREIKISAS
jgi:hypothetical protein